MVLQTFPATLQLAFFTMLLSAIVAVVIGCWAALKPNGVADRIVSFFSMVAASVPDFWLAILGIWIFAISFGWLPTSGVQGGPEVWILPVATLMMRPVGVLITAVAIFMLNIVIDLLYAALDPRVRPTGRSAKQQGKKDNEPPTTGVRTVKPGAIKATVTAASASSTTSTGTTTSTQAPGTQGAGA